jgi:hypothetical protein
LFPGSCPSLSRRCDPVPADNARQRRFIARLTFMISGGMFIDGFIWARSAS